MKKRDFLKTGGVVALGTLVLPNVSCESNSNKKEMEDSQDAGIFSLPLLPYALDALEPFIDVQTMTIHHGKHHAGYVRKLNAALQDHPLKDKDLGDIMGALTADSSDTSVRNSGGGHYNHSLFWKIMAPEGRKKPSGQLKEAINSTFGSFDGFKEKFAKKAANRFGSGWAWLSVDAEGKLFVSSTANQDNPMMSQLVKNSGTPIMGIDVWEHAYYLKYQNRRKEYIDNFFNIINWEEVAANYAKLG
jgi:Fe-Mn family superoxide dismutase